MIIELTYTQSSLSDPTISARSLRRHVGRVDNCESRFVTASGAKCETRIYFDDTFPQSKQGRPAARLRARSTRSCKLEVVTTVTGRYPPAHYTHA